MDVQPSSSSRKARCLVAMTAIAVFAFGFAQPASAADAEEPVLPALASSDPLTVEEWNAISTEHGGGAAVPGTSPQSTQSYSASGPNTVQVDEGQQPNNLLAPSYEAPTAGTGPDPTMTTTATTRPRVTPHYCSATQDRPHQSHTTRRTINTHLRGQCRTGVLVTHALSASTYRLVWWGYLYEYGTSSYTSSYAARLNVPFRCHAGTTYTYRTEGRFHAAFTNGYKSLTWRTTTAPATCR